MAGNYQEAVVPDLSYVPYILFNDKHNKGIETKTRKSFLRTYCELRALDRKPKSVLCNKENLAKYGKPPKARRQHKNLLHRVKFWNYNNKVKKLWILWIYIYIYIPSYKYLHNKKFIPFNY